MICPYSQSKLKQILTIYLNKNYTKVEEASSYIFAEGNCPICLVAHLDTVFPFLPEKDEIFYDPHAEVMWSPQGLGADDRAGVAAIIKIIEDKYRPSILFTLDEETSAEGAIKAITEKLVKPNFKALIELDRKGSEDCVFYECQNLYFKKFISRFGFKEAEGTFSDISVLAPYWNVAAVNLSIGYLYEHSPLEYLNFKWMRSTIEKVEKILSFEKEIPYFRFYNKERRKMKH